MGTSSADPHKLDEYATEGVELVSALRTKVNDVTDALDALSASSSEHLPQYPGLDEMVTDLVDDWAHQDEFVGDVAHGFFEADDGRHESGEVIQVADSTLLSEGEIGYADRDVAIAEAEEMAEELDRLQEEGASAEEMDSFVAMAERGQYDPAFAVTFSEQAGVDGYADATALIRDTYADEGRDLGDAIPQVAVLSTVLTTALDTLPRGENDEYRDASNADLPAGARLGSDFVYDLTRGYEPGDFEGPERPDSHAGLDDLSVLIGLSDPPTEVAIDIAEYRMKPLLEDGNITDSRWHQDGEELAVEDPVVNYATMLARNEDASAGWLSGEGNIELVLDEPGSDCMDDGAALADVVEAALTNDDMHAPPPPGAPSSAEGPLIREELMERAINHMGDQEGEFDIENEHLYGALASGVESNMEFIGDRINDGWELDSDGRNYSHSGTDGFTDTTYFLGEVMGDEDAAERVRAATFDYVESELADLRPGEDGLLPRDEVHGVGRVLGTVMHGDLAAIDEVYDEGVAEAAAKQKLANFATGWIPVIGDANSTSDLVFNVSAGSAFEPPDAGEFADNLEEAERNMDGSVEGLDLAGGRDYDALKAAMYDINAELGGSAYTHG
jgi:hypothetical protein